MTLEDVIKKLNEIDPPLTRLILVDDEIGDEGATALAEALKVNKTLEFLFLYHNRIGDGR